MSVSIKRFVGKARRALVASLMVGMAMVAGCASSVADADNIVPPAAAAKARPDNIYVYAFNSDARDVQLDDHGVVTKLTNALSDDSAAQQQAQQAQKAGAARNDVADAIVAKLQSMGLRAIRADVPPPADQNVLLVKGDIDSIDAGNRRRRMLIGLGAGQSKVGATVQLIYQPAHGTPQLIEQFDADADSGHAPGMAEMVGIGAVAGHAVTSLAVSGGVHATTETKRTTISSDGQRLGDKIAEQIGEIGAAQGWMGKAGA
jgi:ribosomal protein S19E (S16A)